MNCELIIENGYNTSHIYSLLIALFYKNTNAKISYELLHKQPITNNYYYLQELISNNFLFKIHKGQSITTNVLNEIRNYIGICMNVNDFESHVKLWDIKNFYSYLITHISSFKINASENIINIKLDNPLLSSYLMTYNIKNNPILLPIYITKQQSTIPIITKCVKINEKYYEIMSLICFNKSYYVLVYINDFWYMFNDNNISSVSKINLSDKKILKKILMECKMVFYTLTN